MASTERMAVETATSELVTNILQNNPDRMVVCQLTLAIGADLLV